MTFLLCDSHLIIHPAPITTVPITDTFLISSDSEKISGQVFPVDGNTIRMD